MTTRDISYNFGNHASTFAVIPATCPSYVQSGSRTPAGRLGIHKMDASVRWHDKYSVDCHIDNLLWIIELMMTHTAIRSLCKTTLTCIVISLLFIGCGAKEIQPVDLYPEDECANCRMSVSEHAFASEIISQEQEVFKFDDLDCFDTFKNDHSEVTIAAMFVKNYETKEWMPYDHSVIIQTGIATPMGSGKVAVASKERADALVHEYPPGE